MEQVLLGLHGWGGEGAARDIQSGHVTHVSSRATQFLPPDLLNARFGLYSDMEAAWSCARGGLGWISAKVVPPEGGWALQ